MNEEDLERIGFYIPELTVNCFRKVKGMRQGNLCSQYTDLCVYIVRFGVLGTHAMDGPLVGSFALRPFQPCPNCDNPSRTTDVNSGCLKQFVSWGGSWEGYAHLVDGTLGDAMIGVAVRLPEWWGVRCGSSMLDPRWMLSLLSNRLVHQ